MKPFTCRLFRCVLMCVASAVLWFTRVGLPAFDWVGEVVVGGGGSSILSVRSFPAEMAVYFGENVGIITVEFPGKWLRVIYLFIVLLSQCFPAATVSRGCRALSSSRVSQWRSLPCSSEIQSLCVCVWVSMQIWFTLNVITSHTWLIKKIN